MKKLSVMLIAALSLLRASQVVTFKTTSRLVIETVEVKDRKGLPVEGLTQADFTLLENGAPQEIRFFEFQKLPSPTEDLLPPMTKQSPQVSLTARLPNARIAPEVSHRNKRLLVLYVDLTAMPTADRLRAFAAAQGFVRSRMTSSDLVTIALFSNGAVRVLSDFTADRDSLFSALQVLSAREVQGLEEASNDIELGDTGAAFGQNDAEFNIFRTDRQLAGLQTMTRMLGTLNEKKALVYFGSGLRLNGMDNQAQLSATINDAVRAGVSLWPVDSRGLTAEAPMGDASKGSPGGIGMYTGASAMAVSTGLQRSQDSLWTLAADTGGKALFDSNDLAAGIVEAQKATSSYYILGYYTANEATDGKYREVKVTLKGDTSAHLSYRKGYYAPRQFQKLAAADRERQLEDAFLAGDPITDITIAVEIDYFRINRAEYRVPVAVKLPGSELSLSRQKGATRARIDFIGEVKDRYGTTVQNVRDKIERKLDALTASELSRRPVEYQTSFTLLPGPYRLKFLARDLETGRIGTYETAFVIPDLNRKEDTVPISSVVLGGRIPSVTRVFRRSGKLDVYLEAYPTSGSHDLRAFAALYHGQAKVYETRAVRSEAAGTLGAAPVEISLPLGELPAGEYRCQVTVVDSAARKASFWQTNISLIP